MGERMVKCAKLGETLPGLEEPPYTGELGQRIIFGNIFDACRFTRSGKIILKFVYHVLHCFILKINRNLRLAFKVLENKVRSRTCQKK